MVNDNIEEECESQGKIMREGYSKDPYAKAPYKRCPPHKPNCSEAEKIPVKGTLIGETNVKPTCIKSRSGRTTKIPENQKFVPHLQKGGLGQFFDNQAMAYDQESCVKAGIRAKDWNEPYDSLSSKFVVMSNVRENSDPQKAIQFEECRQNALIGYDPEKDPTLHKGEQRKAKLQALTEVKVDMGKAKQLQKKWKPFIDKEG